jgi:hypothetical protein
MAHLAPWTVELAGKVFAAILADIAAGKQAPSDCGKRACGARRGTGCGFASISGSLRHKILEVTAARQGHELSQWQRPHSTFGSHHPVLDRLMALISRRRAELERAEAELRAWLARNRGG